MRKLSWTGTQALNTDFVGVALTMTDHATGPIALGSLIVYLNTLAVGVTLTVRLCRDAAGDELISPEYDADIHLGDTTATDGTAVIDLNRLCTFGVAQIYVFLKLDAGTASATEARLTYVTQ